VPRIKSTINFVPKPDKYREVLLHRYLTEHTQSVSSSIFEAIEARYLPLAMLQYSSSETEIRLAGIDSVVSLTAYIVLIEQVLLSIGIALPMRSDLLLSKIQEAQRSTAGMETSFNRQVALTDRGKVNDNTDDDDDDNWDDDVVKTDIGFDLGLD
jgi:hypothetical protein